MTRDTWNPATWTDTDRAFLDAARQLNAEEQQLLLDLMELLDAEPDKKAARQAWTQAEAGKYRLRTAAGRAAFMADLRAVG